MGDGARQHENSVERSPAPVLLALLRPGLARASLREALARRGLCHLERGADLMQVILGLDLATVRHAWKRPLGGRRPRSGGSKDHGSQRFELFPCVARLPQLRWSSSSWSTARRWNASRCRKNWSVTSASSFPTATVEHALHSGSSQESATTGTPTKGCAAQTGAPQPRAAGEPTREQIGASGRAPRPVSVLGPAPEGRGDDRLVRPER